MGERVGDQRLARDLADERKRDQDAPAARSRRHDALVAGEGHEEKYRNRARAGPRHDRRRREAAAQTPNAEKVARVEERGEQSERIAEQMTLVGREAAAHEKPRADERGDKPDQEGARQTLA